MVIVVEVKRQMREKKEGRGVMLVPPGFNLPTLGCLLFLVIHAGVFATGGTHLASDQLRPIYESAALSWSGIREGRVGALLAHAFFHGNWWHVILNALLFYYTAARLGHVLRPKRLLILFGVSTLGAGLAYITSQALLPGLSTNPLVGASGGVMGMFLAQTVIYPDSRMLFLPISGRNMGKGFLVASLLLFLMTPRLGVPFFSLVGHWLTGLFGEELFQIGHLYHFAAGLSGMLLVVRLLPRLVTLKELQAQRLERESSLPATQ